MGRLVKNTFFSPAKIRLDEKGFVVLNIVFSFLLLFSCAFVLSVTVLIKTGCVAEKPTPKLRYSASR